MFSHETDDEDLPPPPENKIQISENVSSEEKNEQTIVKTSETVTTTTTSEPEKVTTKVVEQQSSSSRRSGPELANLVYGYGEKSPLLWRSSKLKGTDAEWIDSKANEPRLTDYVNTIYTSHLAERPPVLACSYSRQGKRSFENLI